MTKLEQETIVSAVKSLWPDPQYHPEQAIEIVKVGFEKDLLTPSIAREAICGLLRVAMYNNDRRENILSVVGVSVNTERKNEIVSAVIETLIAVPKTIELIDYWEAIIILSQLLQENTLNPIVFQMLKSNITNKNDQTRRCIIESLEYSIRNEKLVNRPVIDILLTVTDTKSREIRSIAVRLIREVIFNDKTTGITIDQLDSIWSSAKNELLNPKWPSEADFLLLMDDPGWYEDYPDIDLVQDSAAILTHLVIRNNAPLRKLPGRLDELPSEVQAHYKKMIYEKFVGELGIVAFDSYCTTTLWDAYFGNMKVDAG